MPDCWLQVEFSGYHQDISTICGSIPGAKQVGDRWSRKWHIPTDKMQQLEAKLKDVSAAVDMVLNPHPSQALCCLLCSCWQHSIPL